jgi:hypothetical protein
MLKLLYPNLDYKWDQTGNSIWNGTVLSICLQEHTLAYQLQFPHLSLSQETLQSKRIGPITGARDKGGKIIIFWQYVCISLPATVSTPLTQPGNFAIK